jgi:hypothetical protein
MKKNKLIIISKKPLERLDTVFLKAQIEIIDFNDGNDYTEDVCRDLWLMIGLCKRNSFNNVTVIKGYNPDSINVFRVKYNDWYIFQYTEKKREKLRKMSNEVDALIEASQCLAKLKGMNIHKLLSNKFLKETSETIGITPHSQMAIKIFIDQLQRLVACAYLNYVEQKIGPELDSLFYR